MANTVQKVHFQDLGRITYAKAWDYQTELQQSLISLKRSKGREVNTDDPPVHQLLFCEHNHVFTLGKSGSQENLLLDDDGLSQESIEFFKINRGGDITYHGPGQITGYPILDLEYFYTDIHRYVREIEESIIRTIAHFGISGFRLPEYTGVWVGEEENKRKICAIGVHLSRWVTMHGFAFNVNTDLQYFDKIIPCGINEKHLSVTSVANEVGEDIDIGLAKDILKKELSEVFHFQYK